MGSQPVSFRDKRFHQDKSAMSTVKRLAETLQSFVTLWLLVLLVFIVNTSDGAPLLIDSSDANDADNVFLNGAPFSEIDIEQGKVGEARQRTDESSDDPDTTIDDLLPNINVWQKLRQKQAIGAPLFERDADIGKKGWMAAAKKKAAAARNKAAAKKRVDAKKKVYAKKTTGAKNDDVSCTWPRDLAWLVDADCRPTGRTKSAINEMVKFDQQGFDQSKVPTWNIKGRCQKCTDKECRRKGKPWWRKERSKSVPRIRCKSALGKVKCPCGDAHGKPLDQKSAMESIIGQLSAVK